LAALTNLVCNDEFTIISAALCVDDLLRFNRQHGLNVAPYSVCLAAIKIKAGIVGSPQLIVDNFDGCSTLLSQADICLKAHEAFRNLPMSIVSRAAPCRANCMPALQAADLIAWEVRRYWDTGYDKNVSTGEFAPRKVFDRLAKESANATCRIESDDLDNYYSRCNRQLLADTFAVR
jgi:hypothetical protein